MTAKYGASFSATYCRYLELDPKKVLTAALKDLGVRRLRLMSYWSVHEPKQGEYDFSELDWQFALAKKHNSKISLAIGLRQPRWPEAHQPAWAKKLSSEEWQEALFQYIEATVKRYKDHPRLESWQLENEALNRSFGIDGEFSRRRLREELRLVRRLDSSHPICMSTSNSWGLPIRQPRPDEFGLSIYRATYLEDHYSFSKVPAWFYKLRASVIQVLTRRSVFIHELQLEPWGPGGVKDLSLNEQYKTMNPEQFKSNLMFATRIGLEPVDLWGVEWWYWLSKKHRNDDMWKQARQLFKRN